MAVILSGTYLFFFVMIILLRDRIYISYRQKRVLLILFSVSMGSIAFSWNPKSGDLIKQFWYLDSIRNSGLSFFEFMVNPISGGRDYLQLYSYNIIRFVVSRLFSNNHWFPAITTFIVYYIFSRIWLDWTEKNGYNLSIYHLLICFTLLPFLYVNSGIRNALAASIMAFGVYEYLSNNRLRLFIIMSLISATIHPVTLIAIPVALISRFSWSLKGFIFTIVVSVALQSVASILSSSSNTYVRMIGRYYLFYTSSGQYRSSMYYVYANAVLIFLFVGFGINRIHIQGGAYISTSNGRLVNFCLLYMCFIIGNLANYDLFLRPGYLLGFFSPILFNIYNTEQENVLQSGIVRQIVSFVILIVTIYIILRYMRFYILL